MLWIRRCGFIHNVDSRGLDWHRDPSNTRPTRPGLFAASPALADDSIANPGRQDS